MKKVVAFFLTVVSCLSACFLTACKKEEDGVNVLKVYVLNQGYGRAWLDKIADAFEAESWVQEQFPGATVRVDASELESSSVTYINAGDANPYDVLFASKFSSFMKEGGYLADLSLGVFEAQVPGENVTVKDKLRSNVTLEGLAYTKADGTTAYYSAPYQETYTGVVYNATKLSALGFEVPRTTDEWVAIMQAVKDLNGSNSAYKRSTSIITYGASTYLTYLLYAWWAQYEGAEEYLNFYNGYDSATESVSPNVLRQSGRLKALEALEKATEKKTGFVLMESSTGRAAYMNAQTKLFTGDALFMANGDWFNNEMKTIRDGLKDRLGSVDEVKLMQTPVISSIIEKTPTINDDATLSAVVKAIDENKTSYENVSDADFQIVKTARRSYYSSQDISCGVVPESSKNKYLAYAFMRYLATDKANEIYSRETDGCHTSYNYNLKEKSPDVYNGLSDFQKSKLSDLYEKELKPFPYFGMCRLVNNGTLAPFKSASVQNLLVTGGVDKGSYSSIAEKLFEDDYTYWTRNANAMWNLCLRQAGV